MSNILIASTPLQGHVTPMLAIADSLKQRGHNVFFLTSETFREKVENHSLTFIPLIGYANYDYREMEMLFTESEAAAIGLEAHIVHLKRLFADSIPDQDLSLRRAADEHEIDLIITDVLFAGNIPMLLQPRETRPPIIACGVIAPMWKDLGSSPFSGPDDTAEGRQRNLDDYQHFDSAVVPGTRYLDRVLLGLGATIPGGFRMFDSLYRLPDQLVQLSTADFEYPLVEDHPNLRFVGPILSSGNGTKPHPAIENLSSAKPIVLVTQGALANVDFDQLINPTIRGLAKDNVQVVVTAGGNDKAKIIEAPNAIIEDYIPYELVLPKASVFVTNGGYNGVQEALSYGVPIISAGASEDKPYVSARIAWSGVGIDLLTGNPRPAQIRDAVYRVLNNPGYRERAGTLGASIVKTNALETIAEIAEETIAASVFRRWSQMWQDPAKVADSRM